jgi:hypothetical protein
MGELRTAQILNSGEKMWKMPIGRLESVGNNIKIGLENWNVCVWTVVIGLGLRASGGLCRREDKTSGS